MKDVILKYIELNEAYHDKKEEMAWIATTIYLTFSVVTLGWMIGKHPPVVFSCLEKSLIAGLFGIIYLCAIRFISFQFYRRWVAVYLTPALEHILSEIKPGDQPCSFPALYKKQKDEEEEKPGNKRKGFVFLLVYTLIPFLLLSSRDICGNKFDLRYKTEIPTYTIITYMFIAQLAVVIFKL